MATPHTGSWGLPDFGFTEWVANRINPSSIDARTGGSQLIANKNDVYNTVQPMRASVEQAIATSPQGSIYYNTGHTTNTNNAGSGSSAPTSADPQPSAPSTPSVDREYENYLNTIKSTYRNLEAQLDPWKAQSEGYINEQYNLGKADIDLAKQAGLDALQRQRNLVQTNQVRNLKDLANSIGQSFNTFSNQLGVMGAGDSSAAKVMMPYALSRLEAQQRGGITRQSADAYQGIDERESQLNTAVLQETNRLNQTRMSEMAALADWFNNARFQISQMKGQDLRGLSENILSQALQRAQEINSQYTARQNALRDWATSISQNIGQLKANLGQVTDPRLLGQLPQYQATPTAFSGFTPTNYQAPAGFGFGQDDERLV